MEDKILTNAVCAECGHSYEITTADHYFLNKFDMPEPGRCAPCRERRRLLFLNMLNLYRRPCDLTGTMMVSNYPPASKYKVAAQKFWYSDAFDPLEYGRPFDFSKPFFSQYLELARVVPRPALFTDFLKDENCDYTNHSAVNKNSYMIFDSTLCEDTFYSYGLESARDSMECHRSVSLELCYEAIDCVSCYASFYLQNCQNCRDSALLLGCIGCSNCIMCCNVTQKKFHILNQEVTPEEFERVKTQLASREGLKALLLQFAQFSSSFPRKYREGVENENATGDYLVRCKDTFECYDCRNIHEGKYCTQSFMQSRDSYCTREVGDGELFYESANAGAGYNLRFCFNCYKSVNNLTYCDSCVNGASDLFGCIGIKGRKYGVLNMLYSESEYHALVPKIVAHMRETGEWGQQFPAEGAPFEYNISEAQQRFPLSKEEALRSGFEWRDIDAKEYRPSSVVIPDSIVNVEDSITEALLSCEKCSRNYRIISQELKLYRRLGLSLPTYCFFCRNEARHHKRNERRLYVRACVHCKVELSSTYAPTRKEVILCERCYANELQ